MVRNHCLNPLKSGSYPEFPTIEYQEDTSKSQSPKKRVLSREPVRLTRSANSSSQSPKKRVLSRVYATPVIWGAMICLNPLKSGSYPEHVIPKVPELLNMASQSPKKRVLSRGITVRSLEDEMVSIP